MNPDEQSGGLFIIDVSYAPIILALVCLSSAENGMVLRLSDDSTDVAAPDSSRFYVLWGVTACITNLRKIRISSNKQLDGNFKEFREFFRLSFTY